MNTYLHIKNKMGRDLQTQCQQVYFSALQKMSIFQTYLESQYLEPQVPNEENWSLI